MFFYKTRNLKKNVSNMLIFIEFLQSEVGYFS